MYKKLLVLVVLGLLVSPIARAETPVVGFLDGNMYDPVSGTWRCMFLMDGNCYDLEQKIITTRAVGYVPPVTVPQSTPQTVYVPVYVPENTGQNAAPTTPTQTPTQQPVQQTPTQQTTTPQVNPLDKAGLSCTDPITGVNSRYVINEQGTDVICLSYTIRYSNDNQTTVTWENPEWVGFGGGQEQYLSCNDCIVVRTNVSMPVQVSYWLYNTTPTYFSYIRQSSESKKTHIFYPKDAGLQSGSTYNFTVGVFKQGSSNFSIPQIERTGFTYKVN